MNKRAVSVTLAAENLLWLRGQVRVTGRRSVSELLDRLVSDVRTDGKAGGVSRSIVGRLRIDPSDPDLSKADVAVGALFTRSLGRPARGSNPPRPRGRVVSRRRRRG